MRSARHVMSEDIEFIRVDTTAVEAARRLAERSIGALPVFDRDDHLCGIVTDRDLAIDVLGAGRDPLNTKVRELLHGPAVTIHADDPIEDAIETMRNHQVRRLPVVDGDRLVGMISQADIARECPPEQVGGLVAALSS